MRRILLAAFCLLPLFLAACDGPHIANGSPTLANIRMYHSVMGTGQYVVEVSAAGDMAIQIQPGTGAIQRASAHLTPPQMAALASAFKGWKDLKPIYPGDWAILMQITYDGYTVQAHDLLQAPANFVAAKDLLDNLARQGMQAATQPTPPPPVSPSAPAGLLTPRP